MKLISFFLFFFSYCQNVKVPWLKIFTSLPVYAIIVANVCSDWGAYTLLTNIPTYINEVLKFDITSVSFILTLLQELGYNTMVFTLMVIPKECPGLRRWTEKP